MLLLERMSEVFDSLHGQALAVGTALEACQEVAAQVEEEKRHLIDKEERGCAF